MIYTEYKKLLNIAEDIIIQKIKYISNQHNMLSYTIICDDVFYHKWFMDKIDCNADYTPVILKSKEQSLTTFTIQFK